MVHALRNRLLAWLIEIHPEVYLRWKRLAQHRLAADSDFLRLHAQLLRAGDCVQCLPERYNLWALARSAQTRPGAFAEVGVYRGGSAQILCAAKGAAVLHLFDTFCGMPEVNPVTDGVFRTGDFGDATLEFVRTRLAAYEGVVLHPGIFPVSAAALAQEKPVFQFVHLDVDLYQSTLAGLNFFYPLLAEGGLLVSHDYNHTRAPGVKRAFDEFLRDKPESVIPMWETQGLLIKLAAPA
jgi:O-methyltransferase